MFFKLFKYTPWQSLLMKSVTHKNPNFSEVPHTHSTLISLHLWQYFQSLKLIIHTYLLFFVSKNYHLSRNISLKISKTMRPTSGCRIYSIFIMRLSLFQFLCLNVSISCISSLIKDMERKQLVVSRKSFWILRSDSSEHLFSVTDPENCSIWITKLPNMTG